MVLKRTGATYTDVLGFRSLQTYMVLKQKWNAANKDACFRSLQTYMVLKLSVATPTTLKVLDPYKLTWFSNSAEAVAAAFPVLDPYKLTWFSNSLLRKGGRW